MDRVEQQAEVPALPCDRRLVAALEDIIEGTIPEPLPVEGCPPEWLAMVEVVNRFICFAREIAAFVVPLSCGELDVPLPSPDNFMAAPLVEMHERLSQLTHQALKIARGDYSQRIDFIGDFSAAFNSMTSLLAEREESLRAEIARREQAEQKLQRERDLLVAGPLVTLRWDVDDAATVQYISPNISAFGYEAEDFTSGRRRYGDIIHPDDFAWAVEDGNGKAQTGLDGWTQEYRLLDAGGGVRWVRDYTHAVRDEDGAVTCYEGYIIDVTAQKHTEAELRRREQQLRMLSLCDDLTGLYNRRGLLALGEHVMRIARRHLTDLTLLYVDVVKLRSINDRFGHARGDEALRRVATALRSALGDADLAGRAGGDEFVALIEGDAEAGAEVCTRMRRRLLALRDESPHQFSVSVSIGQAHWSPQDAADLQELMDRAAAGLRAQAEARPAAPPA